MYRQLVLATVLTLGACTLPQEPITPPVVPMVVQPSAELEAVHQELSLLNQDLATLRARVEILEPLTPRVAQLEAIQATLKKMPKQVQTRLKGPKEPTPLQLVNWAQQEARVVPTERGYFGKSAEMSYVWQPGRVYTVYLKQYQATGIALPPGEQLVIGLAMVESDFTVLPKRAGTDLLAYDTIAVTPLIDKGEVDAWVLTQSGRRYLFHFVIGPVGMIAVTFEAPIIQQGTTSEPKLILPKPQS